MVEEREHGKNQIKSKRESHKGRARRKCLKIAGSSTLYLLFFLFFLLHKKLLDVRALS
jgi:hypothetical protein